MGCDRDLPPALLDFVLDGRLALPPATELVVCPGVAAILDLLFLEASGTDVECGSLDLRFLALGLRSIVLRPWPTTGLAMAISDQAGGGRSVDKQQGGSGSISECKIDCKIAC